MIWIILKQHTRGSWKIAYLWDEGWGEPIFMGAQFLSFCQGMIGCTGRRREVSQVAIMHNATMVPGFHFGVETRVGIDQWRNSTVYITYKYILYIYTYICIFIYYFLYFFIMLYIYLDDRYHVCSILFLSEPTIHRIPICHRFIRVHRAPPLFTASKCSTGTEIFERPL